MKILFIGARLFDDVDFYLKENEVISILTESNSDAPNLDLATEQYIVPRGMDEPIKIAKGEHVNGIIPLIGLDDPLMEVAIAKEKLEKEENIHVIASNINTISITSDKINTKEFFQKHNIDTPKFEIVLSVSDLKDINLNYPIVLKQRSGQAGRDIIIASNFEEAKDYISEYGESLLEEFIEGVEISIEVLGFKCQYLPLVPAYKGETTLEGTHPLEKVRFAPADIEGLDNEKIRKIAYQIAIELKAEGIIDIDFIYSKKDKKLYALEVNARPSGTRYLTAGASGIHPLTKLIDMVSGEFDVHTIEDEMQDYFALEVPIGTYIGPLIEDDPKKFTKDSWVVHGPPNYERITISGQSKEKTKKLAKILLRDRFDDFNLENL